MYSVESVLSGNRGKNESEMKSKEIKGLSTSELTQKISEERAALVKTKLNHSVSPAENPLVIRAKRRTVARMLTELKARKEN